MAAAVDVAVAAAAAAAAELTFAFQPILGSIFMQSERSLEVGSIILLSCVHQHLVLHGLRCRLSSMKRRFQRWLMTTWTLTPPSRWWKRAGPPG